MILTITPSDVGVWAGSEPRYVGVDVRNRLRLIGVGPDLQELVHAVDEINKEFHIPASRQQESLSDRFARLASEWRSRTACFSSVQDMATDPGYQSIIGMGKEVVPLLLGALASRPDHWFWALKPSLESILYHRATEATCRR